MKPVTLASKLAQAFKALEAEGNKTDNTAASVLKIVTDSRCRTLDLFDTAVTDAYTACGWHASRGAPKAGDEALKRVPHTVRNYVWEIRRAFRIGIEVWKYKTFSSLREARLQRRVAAPPGAPPGAQPTLAPELEGVRLAEPDKLTGVIFHDAAVTYMGLSVEARALMARDLARVMGKYRSLAAVLQKVAA